MYKLTFMKVYIKITNSLIFQVYDMYFLNVEHDSKFVFVINKIIFNTQLKIKIKNFKRYMT